MLVPTFTACERNGGSSDKPDTSNKAEIDTGEVIKADVPSGWCIVTGTEMTGASGADFLCHSDKYELGDAIKGTWVQECTDYGTVTWIFDGKGKCSLDTDYLDKAPGTYTIKDESKVAIKIDLWDDEKAYEYTVSDGNLKLTATDRLSPDYDLTKK